MRRLSTALLLSTVVVLAIFVRAQDTKPLAVKLGPTPLPGGLPQARAKSTR